MPWGIAAAAVVGGAISSNAQRGAARDQANASAEASDASLQAAREANDLQERLYNDQAARQDRIYNDQIARQEPFRQSGLNANNALSARVLGGDLGRSFGARDYQQDPGYGFRLREGQNAIENSAASRGMSLSGGTLRALSRYGQDFASNEYQNAYNRFNNDQTNQYNRLAGLAGIGQTATNALNNASSAYGNAMGSASSAYGNSVSANNINATNAVNGYNMNAANNMAQSRIGQANTWNNAIGQGISAYQNNQLMNAYMGSRP
jgi:hypothetical protein